MPGKECIRAALDWAETSAKALGFFTGLNGAIIIVGSFLTIPLAMSQEDLVEDSSMEDDPEAIDFDDQAIKLKAEDLGAPDASQNNMLDEEKKANSKLSIVDDFGGAVGLEDSDENVENPPSQPEEQEAA